MTKLPLTAGVVAAALLAATTAFAEEEAVVNVYNWSDYIDEEILTEFEAETGIKVVYDVFDSNNILETKLLTGSTGYDVVVPSGTFLARQIQAGIFQPLDKSQLANLGNMDETIMSVVSQWDPDNQYAINYMWGTTGFGYNIDKIAERAPDAATSSWGMLFDPDVVSQFRRLRRLHDGRAGRGGPGRAQLHRRGPQQPRHRRDRQGRAGNAGNPAPHPPLPQLGPDQRSRQR